MIPAILAALNYAPSVLAFGKQIFNAVTGTEAPASDDPEDLAKAIDALPADQKADVSARILDFRAKMQALDTQRFVSMNDGDAEKVRATARPEIALRAMGVISIFSKAAAVLFVATVLEWLLRAGFAVAGKPFPITDSLWSLIADAAPAAEMIWGPLIASFWVSAEIVKKYMGCRERDKAQQYEMMAGKPLNSTQATIQAAGGAVSNLIKAWRGTNG